ncbi:MAG: hypothetical protein HC769_16730 [Cyanobacteria bacterium CRU_2_1]|nr:hypothetical protein [Cyanobacteria bacterium RU_5_0]NJR60325.1 hypothetical protein [Cyanobacteria bacterium CRU_2_1]
MFQLAYALIHGLIQAIQFLTVPICFVSAWVLVLMLFWSMWAAVREGVANAKQMHQVPCANCRFFTGNYHLKCPVHPKKALSDAAIGCSDYEPASYWATNRE